MSRKDRYGNLVIVNDISMPGGLAKASILLARNTNAIILSLTGNEKTFFDTEGVQIESLNLRKLHTLKFMSRLFWYFRCFFKLYFFIHKSRYKNVIAIGGVLSIILAVMRFNGVVTIGSEHTSYSSQGKFRRLLKKMCYWNLDHLVVLTERDKINFQSYSKRIHVIPNFINEGFSYIARACPSRILFVGRLTKTKGSDYLLRIVKNCLEKFESVTFCIVGETDSDILIEELSAFSDRVLYISSTKDMDSVYRKSDVLLSCSRAECFPMIFLEAKCYSLPIVAFDCETGPAELVVNGLDGFIVPVGDIDALIDRVGLLLSDYSLYQKVSKASYESRKKFSLNNFEEKWVELLSH